MGSPTTQDLLLQILRTRFGFEKFRPHQAEICEKVTEGRDALLVMPTGAGKSLCYQLPGLARERTTIVISPLLALIEDQVTQLQARGIRADRIHSGRKREDLRETCKQYLRGELQFIFIAPERLSVPGFIEMLKKQNPSLVAIDEAHCISQWGHDFRPDYRLLGERLNELRPAPVIALTATATPLVQDDICKQLGLKDEIRSIQGFRRTNITLQVTELVPSLRLQAIQSILKDSKNLPAIVYAPTRKAAEQLYQDLGTQFSVGIYHAGISAEARETNQNRFLEGKVQVIVATVAFGMGIDKANIRTVIHAALPGSVEGYYQEIGRAGRDGLPSRALLIQSYIDHRTHNFFFERDYPEIVHLKQIWNSLKGVTLSRDNLREKLSSMEPEIFDKSLEKLIIHRGITSDADQNLSQGVSSWEKTYQHQRDHRERQAQQMVDYARSSQCRMLSLVRHFGDKNDPGKPCGNCDFCNPTQILKVSDSRKLSQVEQQLVAQIMAILSQNEGKSVGRLFLELTEQYPKLQRGIYEELLRVLASARWIEIQQETFEKDGVPISYRKVSVTSDGEKATAEKLARLEMSAKPAKPKSSRSKKAQPGAKKKTSGYRSFYSPK